MIERCELYPDTDYYPAMLVGKKPDNASELMASHKYIGQMKKDGYWYELVKNKHGEIYLFSRSKSKTTGFYSEKIANVPHIKKWAEQLPNDTILIGEIYYEGKTSKDVTRIMGCLPQKAVERQEKEGKIQYYIHDILRYDGKNFIQEEQDFEHRYSFLCEYVDILFCTNDIIYVAPSKTGYDLEETIYRWMEKGQEGGVLKLKSGLYLPGKRRPKDMFKVKQEANDLDLIVMDFIAPEKMYTGKELETWKFWENGTPVTKPYALGWKMGYILGAYDDNGKLIEVCRCSSGLTDAMRAECAENPDKFLGNCVTIQGMSVDKKELSVRHPRFISTHFDKPAEDCKLTDIFGA